MNHHDFELVVISCGAAVLSREVEGQVRERFRKKYNKEVIIRQGYGMSESTLRVITSALVIKPGSVGQLVPGVYCKVKPLSLLSFRKLLKVLVRLLGNRREWEITGTESTRRALLQRRRDHEGLHKRRQRHKKCH